MFDLAQRSQLFATWPRAPKSGQRCARQKWKRAGAQLFTASLLLLICPHTALAQQPAITIAWLAPALSPFAQGTQRPPNSVESSTAATKSLISGPVRADLRFDPSTITRAAREADTSSSRDRGRADAQNLLPASPAEKYNGPASSQPNFAWRPALRQSFLLLGAQHIARLKEEKTRDQLGGKFFPEWGEAISNLHGWSDGDDWTTQYLGHPLQGAWVSFIYIQNDQRGRMSTFNDSKEYWHSRLRAMAYSAAYEVQWHLGPISEATIGHVGKKDGTLGYSEFVTSPLGGFGITVAEDWVDAKVVAPLERNRSLPMRRFLRVAFNPERALANVLRGQHPWYRDYRPLEPGLAVAPPAPARQSSEPVTSGTRR